MGRKKLAMRKIENSAARQVTYAKRKEGIVKKAKELSVLCDTDVALIMFSPIGRLTSFASNGSRVEDVFLRFVDRPDELRGGPISNEQFLSRRLKQLKYEGAMLEKIAVIEDLEEKLDKLNRRQRESQEKMRYYEPNLEKISSVLEVGVYQQFLASAIQRIQLLKGKLLGNQILPENTEGTTAPTGDAISANGPPIDGNRNGMMNPVRIEGPSHSMGHHLSLNFIEAQKQWNKRSTDISSIDNY